MRKNCAEIGLCTYSKLNAAKLAMQQEWERTKKRQAVNVVMSTLLALNIKSREKGILIDLNENVLLEGT
jgi:hypothetical protein